MPTLLQAKHGNSPSITLDQPVTNRSLLIAFALPVSGSNVASIASTPPTDNQLNDWSQELTGFIYDYYGSTGPVSWFTKRCAPGTTTVTFPSLDTGVPVSIYEFSGFADFEGLGFFGNDIEAYCNVYPGDIAISMAVGTAGSPYVPGAGCTLIESAAWTAADSTIWQAGAQYQIVNYEGSYPVDINNPPFIGTPSFYTIVTFRPIAVQPPSGPTLTSLLVIPPTATVLVGQTQQYSAVAVYSDGSRVDVTNSSLWSVNTLAVASISSTGLATGITVGTSIVIAVYSGLTANALLNVVNVALLPSTVYAILHVQLNTEDKSSTPVFTGATLENV